MILVEHAPQRASIVTRGRKWARGVLVAGVLVAVAAGVVLWLLVPHGASTPSQVARDFLQSTSCSRLYELATDRGDEQLNGSGCVTMIGAAKGERTYTDRTPRRLDRTLTFGEPIVDGRSARVHVQIAYAGGAEPVPEETLVLELIEVGNDWQVDDWGIPNS